MNDDPDREDWSLEDVLGVFLDARQDEIQTAMPGRVERYDASNQTASIAPMVRRAVPNRAGRYSFEALPTVHAVPVVWLRAGSWFAHMPLAAGDFVLLLVLERDPSAWRQRGELSDPVDTRVHHLSHAVAIPGLYPRSHDLGDTPADALVLGRDGGATVRVRNDGVVIVDADDVQLAGTSALSLASPLDAHLSAIARALDALMTLASMSPSPVPEPNYGTAAKALLDASNAIAAQKVKGS